MTPLVIALSGQLGSGKSSVAQLLADYFGASVVSTGSAQREIAAKRGISTLELNRLSETDPSIDEEIDGVFRGLVSNREPLIVDSRLAWHFLPTAFAVHLVVSQMEGARRVLERGDTAAESYRSQGEAQRKIAERAESERSRFLTYYHIDVFELDNYDLVIDTTTVGPEEVSRKIIDWVKSHATTTSNRQLRSTELWLTPFRVIPTVLLPDVDNLSVDDESSLVVRSCDLEFWVLDGHRMLANALEKGEVMVDAQLVGQRTIAGEANLVTNKEVVGSWESRFHYRLDRA